jgi:hypothetical protein
MYNLGQVVGGITNYLDEEILTKIAGWQKWVIGAGLGVALNKSTNLFNTLKTNPMIKALDVIDKNDMIDVETLYKEIKKQARKGPITFNVPMIGNMTLNEGDVDKIYNNIKEFE